jgi:suppressor for copper-sensitivity B
MPGKCHDPDPKLPAMPLMPTRLALRLCHLFVAGVIAFAVMAGSVLAEQSAPHDSPALSARLITAENGVAPGSGTLSGGLDLRMAAGWKTYWRSPGEVGFPPEVDWSGSRNIASVEFLFPAPHRFTAFGIENFGYADEVVFPLRITLENPGEPAELAATVSLLMCSDVCIPEDFALTLTVADGTGIDSDAAARITRFAALVPDTAISSDMAVTAAYLNADQTALIVTAQSDRPFAAPDIFPEYGIYSSFGAPDVRLGDGGRTLWASLPVLSLDDDLPPLMVTITDGARAATLPAALVTTAPAPPFSVDRVLPGVAEIAWIALVAFLGGLILNVMPCVLPVLSIKLGSVIAARGQDRARVRGGFMMAALGVMIFIWALAAITLAVQGAGGTVGWGLQFQNPVFLTLMVVVLAVFAANLLGAFEIALPSSVQTRLARSGGHGGGYAGDFATGAFAAVMATPCSAPLLGTAVAFALTGRPVDIVIVFTALGLGLALPYILVAAFPGLVARLPKPGRWMVWVKLVLGALLLLTAGWLIWVLVGVGGQGAALAVLALTAALIAVLTWLPGPRALTVAAAALLAILPLVAAATLGGADRQAALQTDVQTDVQTDWAAFDRGEIARRVAAGDVVFVDVTADWCLTCIANKTLVVDRDPVATALAAPGVVPMRADWTRPDDRIAQYLSDNNRFGIPFNAVYGPGAPDGIILSEILTSSAVLDALVAAATRQTASP